MTAPEYTAEPALAAEAARARWLSACEAARPKVYRALIAMGAPRDDAEDALQDALEAALRLSTPADRPEGWLFVVAMRRWHRQRWRQHIFHPLKTLFPSTETDREGEIDLLVELAKLPERQRTVLVARHVLGLSQNETASALQIAPGTVGSIGHRAIRALRQRLED